VAKIEDLKQLSILGVADSLGMELERKGSQTFPGRNMILLLLILRVTTTIGFLAQLVGMFFLWYKLSVKNKQDKI